MRSEALQELLADFFSRMDRGETPDFEAILREHPEHATELRLLFDDECVRLEAASHVGRLAVPPLTQSEAGTDFAAEVVARLAHRAANFARYSIGDEIGKGGMGSVRRVWDEDLCRDLAMKVAREDVLGGKSSGEIAMLARFLQEARVTSRLDHPGVVPVHELGLDPDGRVYFTMKLVKGRTFAEVLELVRNGAEGWTQTRALGVIQRVCEAMAYAHDKGVLHRDLKPANVMVGEFGEVYVMDWGLARLLRPVDPRDHDSRDAHSSLGIEGDHDRAERGVEELESPSLTRDGQVVGTPAYMAPEQAAGRVEELGPHSDVYAVGAMLYHLFAGRPPHDRRTNRREDVATWKRGLEEPPAPLPASVPMELAAICDKAMSRDWRARYRDLAVMSADLTAFIEGRVVQAYEKGALAEARKWVRRNRGFAGSLAAALLVLVIGVVVSLRQKVRADAQAMEASTIANFLEQTIEGVKPSVALGRDSTMLREMMDAAWTRIENGELSNAPQAELRINWLIGDALRELGQFERAESVLRHAVAAARALGVTGEPYLAWSLSDLALVLVQREERSEAEAFAREAVDISRRLFSAEDPNVTTRLANLASVLTAGGAYAEAESLLREALETSERAHAGDVEAIAEFTGSLAVVLSRQGKSTEAEELARRSLNLFTELFPGPHPSVAIAQSNLSEMLRWRGELAEAEAFATRALEARRSIFKGDQANVAEALDSLGRVRHARADLEGAESVSREALEMRRRLWPGDHVQVTSSLNNLGTLLKDRGDLVAAEGLLRESLEMRRRLSPGDDLDVARSLNNLGMLLMQRGDSRGAESALVEAVDMLDRLGLGDDPMLAAVNVNVGQLLESRGDATGAESRFRAALKISRAVLSGPHPATIRSGLGLGGVLLARGNFSEAAEVLTEIEALTRNAEGVHPTDRRRCLKLLVETFNAWERSNPGAGHGAKADHWSKEH